MFIHYGLYSGLAGEWKGRPGGSEWIQKNVEVDTDTYAAEALPLFKPREGLTEEWAQLARDAGCQYVVLTSKHHEGFGLFDSVLTDYDAKSARERDIIREYVDSCRKRGLKVGLYHSVIDWHHPSYDNTICPGTSATLRDRRQCLTGKTFPATTPLTRNTCTPRSGS